MIFFFYIMIPKYYKSYRKQQGAYLEINLKKKITILKKKKKLSTLFFI